MDEIVIFSVPEEVSKALLKEYDRMELMKKSRTSPFIKSVCNKRQDLIYELIYGKQRERS